MTWCIRLRDSDYLRSARMFAELGRHWQLVRLMWVRVSGEGNVTQDWAMTRPVCMGLQLEYFCFRWCLMMHCKPTSACWTMLVVSTSLVSSRNSVTLNAQRLQVWKWEGHSDISHEHESEMANLSAQKEMSRNITEFLIVRKFSVPQQWCSPHEDSSNLGPFTKYIIVTHERNSSFHHHKKWASLESSCDNEWTKNV